MPSLSHPLLTTGQLGAVLQATQIPSWLLRASDGHAKYFSIQLLPRGRFPLTRLYDVMSAYPVLGDSRNQWSPFEIKPAMSSARTARVSICATAAFARLNSAASSIDAATLANPGRRAGPWPVWLRWCRRRAGPGPWLMNQFAQARGRHRGIAGWRPVAVRGGRGIRCLPR